MSEFAFQPTDILDYARQRESQLLDEAELKDEDVVVGFRDDGGWNFCADAVMLYKGEKILFIEEAAVLSEIGGKPFAQQHKLAVLIGEELGAYTFAGYRSWDVPITEGSDLEERLPLTFLGRISDLIHSGLIAEYEDAIRILHSEVQAMKEHGRNLGQWPPRALEAFQEMLA